MAIVPTQLPGFADGTMSQGFSTMYDMKLLSTYNRVGDVAQDAEDGQYSWLLVAGKMIDGPKNDYLGVFVMNDNENHVITKASV